jgi:drug/metabolite transporter (DMT)-like permease
MSWFFIALIGPFLYAITNHIDKVLLDKYFKEGGVGTLILFSSLLSVLAIPIIFFADPSVLGVDPANIFILALVGIFNLMILWFYLLALQNDEASVTIVFYQLVPVIGLVLGYFILGEMLSQMELVAMAIIILGTTIIAFEIDIDNSFKFRKKTAMYMLAASFLWALESTIFKAVALEENVWRSLFWEHIVLVVVGILIFLFIPKYRDNFKLALKKNSKAIISLNITNEVLYMVGNIVLAFAFLLAPIALILLTESFQPIFVLIIGIILTIYFPKISVENIEAKHLWQKSFAIAVTGIGTYILLFIA